ncbi:hypothetical protein EHS25_007637 [Saitozyma podzolica]|uniref:NAA35-like N-terminal domain-containing protein n=1 Tax=Saitozyma podzolica TaxID=1890683 RepID=A0A427YQB0_9TREE|nr:hypothetical protein EHS25_007637 [Saitozyma podzolica]
MLSAVQGPHGQTARTGPAGRHEFASELPFDPAADLSADEACWIMDEMMATETVYTSLYYHNPGEIAPTTPVTSALRAYVLAYCKTIDLAYTELSKGHIYDGEDCWLDHYGLPVQLSDSVGDINHILDMAIEEADVEGLAPLAHRLSFRKGLLNAFAEHTGSATETNLEYDPSFLESITIMIAPVEASSRARGSFDTRMPSHLRQNMPLPAVAIPSHSETWKAMGGINSRLKALAALLSTSDPMDWECALRGHAWIAEDLPILRSMFKTAFCPPRGVDAPVATDDIVASTLSAEPNVMDRLESSLPSEKLRQYLVWKDLVRGYTVATFTTPLMNRSRQRRSYLSLAHSWNERATLAEQFDVSVAASLHVLRLDCLLEAAIAAEALNLISSDEESAAWWWIERITFTRRSLAPSATWRNLWSESWRSIATAMRLLIALAPMSAAVISRENFQLRYKWERKQPMYLASGKLFSALRPAYWDFCRAQAQEPSQASASCDVADSAGR